MSRKYKLELTAGYTVDFKQISRIIKLISDNSVKDRKDMGINKRQRGILFGLSEGTGLTKSRRTELTVLGKIVAENDPYFDKLETLEILHYNIASCEKLIVWNRIFNEILQKEDIISENKAHNYFEDIFDDFSKRTINKNLPREINSTLRTYSESKFSRLNMLEIISTGKYKKTDMTEINKLSFCYALLQFRDNFYKSASALEIKSIIEEENSPGRLFQLEKYQIKIILEKLHDMELIRIETFGDLEQIRFSNKVNKELILKKIYGIIDD